MAIDVDISSEALNGNSSTTDAYVVSFPFFDNSHIQVEVLRPDGLVAVLQEGVDYTLSGAGQPTGGSFTTTYAWSEEHLLTISRSVPATQLTRYEEGGEFPSASHERALDKLTMLGQQLLRQARKSFRVREADGDLAPARKIANSLAGLDASGHPVFRSADAVKAWLSLAAPILNFPTKTWEDDAERALAVPDFVGQVGTQRNQSNPPTALYVADGLSAGDWHLIDAGVPDGSITEAKLASMLDLSGKTLSLPNAIVTAALMNASAIHEQTEVASLVGDDEFLVWDESVSALRKVKYSNIPSVPSGSVIQTKFVENNSYSSINSVIPNDDTIPQSGEGTQILSSTITPISTSNKVLVTVSVQAQSGSAYVVTVAVFRSGLSDALIARPSYLAAGSTREWVLQYLDTPSSTGELTYTVRIGTSAGTIYLNAGSSGAAIYGGAARSTMTVQEIKG